MIKSIYKTIRELLEVKVFGTKFAEAIWRTRHLYKKGWSREYLFSVNHPHREQIVEEISSFYPFENVLEVGCSSGPNLLLLNSKFPKAAMYGIDINPDAIRTLTNYVREKNISNISCFVGKADNLKMFPDKCVDVVFTDAVLMFIGADKIDRVIGEIGRVAKCGMVFNEFHSDFPPPDNYEGGRYIHNYRDIIIRHFPAAKMSIKKSAFTGGLWDAYGSLIRVEL